jgi:hypothetical protein
LQLPFHAASPGTLHGFSGASGSLSASSLVAEASAAAAYDRVLARFRNGSTVSAFTSNSLASLAPAYARARNKARRRIAEEWQQEGRKHEDANRRRAQHAAAELPAASSSSSASVVAASSPSSLAHIPFTFDVPSLGTLRLSATSVRLGDSSSSGAVVVTGPASPLSPSSAANTAAAFAPEAELSVKNTADYPVAIRVGDARTASWLRTNTPRFLAPGAACIVTFSRVQQPQQQQSLQLLTPLQRSRPPSPTAGSKAAVFPRGSAAGAAAAAASSTAALAATVPAAAAETAGSFSSPAAANVGVSSSASDSASASALVLPSPPSLPTTVSLRVKPCELFDLEQQWMHQQAQAQAQDKQQSQQPESDAHALALPLFEGADGEPSRRVGECIPLTILQREPPPSQQLQQQQKAGATTAASSRSSWKN